MLMSLRRFTKSLSSLQYRSIGTETSFISRCSVSTPIGKQMTRVQEEEMIEGLPEYKNERHPVIKREIKKYHLGRRWLARMMGEDPDTFTQEDIDKAIEYLLPSHLLAKDARPTMKHPNNLYKFLNETKLDEKDRPFSPGFFTGLPNCYDLVYEIWCIMEKLDNGEPIVVESKKDANNQKDLNNNKDGKLVQWLAKHQLEGKLGEQLDDKLYNTIIFRLKKLAKHPRANEIQHFLDQYQTETSILRQNTLEDVQILDGETRAIGYRKTAIADVSVRFGTGNFTVNNEHVAKYFVVRNDLDQLMFPLLLIDALKKFDIDAQVIGGGHSGKSGAIRLGMCKAIAAMCPEHYEVLYNYNLLLRDVRRRERKKIGLRRARRAPQWVKR